MIVCTCVYNPCMFVCSHVCVVRCGCICVRVRSCLLLVVEAQGNLKYHPSLASLQILSTLFLVCLFLFFEFLLCFQTLLLTVLQFGKQACPTDGGFLSLSSTVIPSTRHPVELRLTWFLEINSYPDARGPSPQPFPNYSEVFPVESVFALAPCKSHTHHTLYSPFCFLVIDSDPGGVLRHEISTCFQRERGSGLFLFPSFLLWDCCFSDHLAA